MTVSIKKLSPKQAYDFLEANPGSLLLDVRDPVEYAFVGHAPGSLNIPWKFAPDMRANPEFLDQVAHSVKNLNVPLLLMCRSGQRSMAAAECLAEAGYTHLANIEEGFEGPIDAEKHRGTKGGWRFHRLPWIQG